MSVEREIGYSVVVHGFSSSNAKVIIPATYEQNSSGELQIVHRNNGIPITNQTINALAGAPVDLFYVDENPRVRCIRMQSNAKKH